MYPKTDHCKPRNLASRPPREDRNAKTAQIANLLEAAGYRFVAADAANPVAVVGAGLPGEATWTVGLVIEPTLRELGQTLDHAVEVVGCDAVLVVCRTLPQVQAVATKLEATRRLAWWGRISLMQSGALRWSPGRFSDGEMQ